MFAASTYEEIERIESQVENMEIVVYNQSIHGCQQSVFVVLQTCTVPDSDI